MGLQAETLAPLQRVLYAAASLVNDLKSIANMTSALKDALAYLSDMPTVFADVPSFSRLCTSSSGDYVIPRTRLEFGGSAFTVSAPLAWNNPPRELITTKCTATCKRLLETFSFDSE